MIPVQLCCNLSSALHQHQPGAADCARLSVWLQIFERTDLANSAETSASLAVKRFARTVGRHKRLLLVQLWKTLEPLSQ